MNNNITKTSKIYAQSLFDLATEKNITELFKNQLSQVVETIQGSDDLKIVMANSAISVEKKIEIIDEIFKNKIENNLLSFLKILVEKNRFEELNSIAEYFDKLEQEQTKVKDVEIICAINPNDETKNNIVLKLEEKLHRKVIPNWTVDETIIAGLIFKFDDCVIDTSIKTKIKNLAREISR